MAFKFTPIDLERALSQTIGVWTADFLLKSPQDKGVTPTAPTTYPGAIPSFQAGPSAAKQMKAPSIAVRASAGSYHREQGEATVHVAVLTWDDNLNRLGYQDVSNIIERIRQGLQEAVWIANAFPLLDEPITWELIDDPSVDYHPYYLGMLTAKFGIMSLGPNATPYGDVGPDTFLVGGVPE